jgi:hypothetical protein
MKIACSAIIELILTFSPTSYWSAARFWASRLTCTLISGLPSAANPFWAATFSKDMSRMNWVMICRRGVCAS